MGICGLLVKHCLISMKGQINGQLIRSTMFRRIKEEFSILTSHRVKSVEYHPTEPILAISLFDGLIEIFNTNTNSLLRTIHVENNKPVRCVRFFPSLHWIIAAGDNLTIYCYDFQTGNLATSYPNAHADFIRQISIHPTKPFFLSCSDDNLVKLFKIEHNALTLEQTFTGHTNFVLDVKINPKDPSTFATASMDQKIHFWDMNMSTRRFSLIGHHDAVNCIEFFPKDDRPYIASGSDDCTINIWDYQTKSCVITLAGHRENVTSIKFHPIHPMLFSLSEDNMFLIWNTISHENEVAIDYQKERGWSIDVKDNKVALGYDKGLCIVSINRESKAIITMDPNGRAFWARNNAIQSANMSVFYDDTDDIVIKDISTLETYPIAMQYNSSHRYVAVWSYNEYSIYSSLAWRAKAFGSARHFAWGIGDQYAIRTNAGFVQLFFSFAQNDPISFQPPFDLDKIFGGYLLGLRGDDFISFYTWESTPILVRQIDVKAKDVIWSPSGSFVSILTSESLYILQYNETNDNESVFVLVAESPLNIQGGFWFDDIFLFNDESNVISFIIPGSQSIPLFHTDKSLTLIGYVTKTERLLICDIECNFFSYSLPLSILQFISSVSKAVNSDEGSDKDIDISIIPNEWKSKMCFFLEQLELFHLAFVICNNDEKKFELALKIDNTRAAYEIAQKTNSLHQFSLLSNYALKHSNLSLLRDSLIKSANDSGLLLLASCEGTRKGMQIFENLPDLEQKESNVLFAASFASSNFDKCIDILMAKGKIPEAALMARTYCPKRLSECAIKWSEMLKQKGDSLVAQTIALPTEYPEKFPQFQTRNGTGNSEDIESFLEEMSDI